MNRVHVDLARSIKSVTVAKLTKKAVFLQNAYNSCMGRAKRKHAGSSALRTNIVEEPTAELEHLEVLEDILVSIDASLAPAEEANLLREVAALSLHQEDRSPDSRPSRLPKQERSFRLSSPLIAAVADDPRFHDDLQVMVDIDSTLFPMDDALREMGVHMKVRNISHWGEGGDSLGDAIMIDYWGRDDLVAKNLGKEEKAERGRLLGEFFARMHSSGPRMERSGVYEYAPQLMQLLHMHGIKLHVFTHRSERAQQSTREWLLAMNIPYDHLRVEDPAGDRVRSDKVLYCQENRISVCVDDKPDTIRRAEAAGIEALSLDWKYASNTIRESGADPAGCWRELGEGILLHIENRIRERALREGITLPGVEQPAEVV